MTIPPTKGSPAYANELYRRRDMLQKELAEVQQEIDQLNSQGDNHWSTDQPAHSAHWRWNKDTESWESAQPMYPLKS